MVITTTRSAVAVLFVWRFRLRASRVWTGAERRTGAPMPLAFEPTSVIPLDKAVTTGTLPNGLRYYVRQNAPSRRSA